MNSPPPRIVGRGAVENLPNRFEQVRLEVDLDAMEVGQDENAGPRKIRTEFYDDDSRSLIRENQSPDIPFRFSINPYRGCEHGCAYCYARTGHETLGWSAGIDFETKVLVKRNAPTLLRRELCRPSWKGEVIAVSGYTDCYQPAERAFRVTRGCIEVFSEAQQAFGIVTKNSVVTRDIDLLAPLAKNHLVQVNLSVTSLDPELARKMEPRTAAPATRLRTIRELADAGIPVRVMVSPVVPGLTDHELPNILQAARDAGATSSSYQMLRLPLSVEPVFFGWLQEHYPQYRERIENRVRQMHKGKIYDSQFGQRMRGSGALAESIRTTYKAFSRRLGLDRASLPLDTSRFRPPADANGQRHLF